MGISRWAAFSLRMGWRRREKWWAPNDRVQMHRFDRAYASSARVSLSASGTRTGITLGDIRWHACVLIILYYLSFFADDDDDNIKLCIYFIFHFHFELLSPRRRHGNVSISLCTR